VAELQTVCIAAGAQTLLLHVVQGAHAPAVQLDQLIHAVDRRHRVELRGAVGRSPHGAQAQRGHLLGKRKEEGEHGTERGRERLVSHISAQVCTH